MKTKIEHVERQFAQKSDNPFKSILQEHYSIPPGHRLRVSLLDADGRKKCCDVAADNWLPASGRMEIWLEPEPPAKSNAVEMPGCSESSPRSSSGVPKPPKEIPGPDADVHPAETDIGKVLARAEGELTREAELLRALDRAESRPGWSFVPLKKFRDEILPSEHIPSMRSDVEQRKGA